MTRLPLSKKFVNKKDSGMQIPATRQDFASVEIAIAANSIKSVPAVPDSNNQKLASCPLPHKFTFPQRDASGKVKTWKCAVCHGEVPDDVRTWYNLGFLHGLQTENPRYPDVSADGQRHRDITRT